MLLQLGCYRDSWGGYVGLSSSLAFQITEFRLRCWGAELWELCTEELEVHRAISAAARPDCAGDRTLSQDTAALEAQQSSVAGSIWPRVQLPALWSWAWWLCFLLRFLLWSLLLPSPYLLLLRSLKIHITIIILLILPGESTCVLWHTWRSEDSFQELVLLTRDPGWKSDCRAHKASTVIHLVVSVAFSWFLCGCAFSFLHCVASVYWKPLLNICLLLMKIFEHLSSISFLRCNPWVWRDFI